MPGHRKHMQHELQFEGLRRFRLHKSDLVSLVNVDSRDPYIPRHLQRDKYSGKPSVKDLRPALLAGALGGSSVGKARREIITMAQ